METTASAYDAVSREPSGWGKLWGGVALAAISYATLIALQVVGVIASRSVAIDANIVLAASELTAGCLALAFLAALGGKGIAKPSLKGMGTAWKAAAWLFIADGTLVAVELTQIALGIEPFDLASNWPARLGLLALLCLGVGMLEETAVRGLLLNGLLARMGRTRAGVYGAAIIASLAFGMMHFDFLIDFTDPLQVAQNCLKVLQAGMCGFLFAAIFVRTRNIWTVITIHAANDFMLLFLSNGLVEAPVTTDYVQTGDVGSAVLLTYVIICVIYVPFLFVGKRCIDEASPWRGGLYRPASQPAPQAPIAQPVASAPAPAPFAQPVEQAERPRGKHARIPSDLAGPSGSTAPDHKELT